VYDHGTPVSIPPVTVVPDITKLLTTSVFEGTVADVRAGVDVGTGTEVGAPKTVVTAGIVYDQTSPVEPVPMTVVPGIICAVGGGEGAGTGADAGEDRDGALVSTNVLAAGVLPGKPDDVAITQVANTRPVSKDCRSSQVGWR
jgi:hypothetical protein